MLESSARSPHWASTRCGPGPRQCRPSARRGIPGVGAAVDHGFFVLARRFHPPAEARYVWCPLGDRSRRAPGRGCHRRVAGRDLVAALIATDLLSGTADVVGQRFRRRNCCLFYQFPGGGYCGDCALTE
ncbi:(2Fe-2S)-binding protein [Mycobacterium sp. TNTM28]|uniref:(2Fe-2S)-binding protein n=1 Tax=[Mycobacterium] fortunisiensis TaxID=2600579 RepID=A0ABS6KJL7_9MYCO|nr:(2Fe-2S)-binding protein [[Mycobacterium] fortunisiensis]